MVFHLIPRFLLKALRQSPYQTLLELGIAINEHDTYFKVACTIYDFIYNILHFTTYQFVISYVEIYKYHTWYQQTLMHPMKQEERTIILLKGCQVILHLAFYKSAVWEWVYTRCSKIIKPKLAGFLNPKSMKVTV